MSHDDKPVPTYTVTVTTVHLEWTREDIAKWARAVTQESRTPMNVTPARLNAALAGETVVIARTPIGSTSLAIQRDH